MRKCISSPVKEVEMKRKVVMVLMMGLCAQLMVGCGQSAASDEGQSSVTNEVETSTESGLKSEMEQQKPSDSKAESMLDNAIQESSEETLGLEIVWGEKLDRNVNAEIYADLGQVVTERWRRLSFLNGGSLDMDDSVEMEDIEGNLMPFHREISSEWAGLNEVWEYVEEVYSSRYVEDVLMKMYGRYYAEKDGKVYKIAIGGVEMGCDVENVVVYRDPIGARYYIVAPIYEWDTKMVIILDKVEDKKYGYEIIEEFEIK